MDLVDQTVSMEEKHEKLRQQNAADRKTHNHVILLREPDGTASRHNLRGTAEERLEFIGQDGLSGRWASGYHDPRLTKPYQIVGNDAALKAKVEQILRDQP